MTIAMCVILSFSISIGQYIANRNIENKEKQEKSIESEEKRDLASQEKTEEKRD